MYAVYLKTVGNDHRRNALAPRRRRQSEQLTSKSVETKTSNSAASRRHAGRRVCSNVEKEAEAPIMSGGSEQYLSDEEYEFDWDLLLKEADGDASLLAYSSEGDDESVCNDRKLDFEDLWRSNPCDLLQHQSHLGSSFVSLVSSTSGEDEDLILPIHSDNAQVDVLLESCLLPPPAPNPMMVYFQELASANAASPCEPCDKNILCTSSNGRTLTKNKEMDPK
mmetsp:Transcript_49916/g.143718  ORF Transcript_49916/g.143718 Transcript_49916/m.143718 type:complete len:222 (+) Transcript_49916:349-1014(+)